VSSVHRESLITDEEQLQVKLDNDVEYENRKGVASLFQRLFRK